MKIKFQLLLFIAFLIFFNHANSQMIAGKVINESGKAAANIKVKFTNKANTISTNKDGSFKIMATKLPDTLIFSADGYEPYKVVVTEKTVIDPDFSIVLLTKRGKSADGYDDASDAPLSGTEMMTMAGRGMLTASTADGYSGASTTYRSKSSEGIKYGGSDDVTISYGKVKKTSFKGSTAGTGRSYYTEDSIEIEKEQYATKLLTAGEVNDFSKWKMWEDYSENDFLHHASYWKLFARKRYSVQVQTKNKYAAVGQTVYLIDALTMDTVWQAVTDNTGKAELWGKMNTSKAQQSNYIILCEGETIKITKPYLFHEGINRITLTKDCITKNVVDISFVVDATGSMGDEIEYLKLELEDVLTKTFSQYNNLELRASSVFYKDEGDDYVTKYVNFNSDLLKVLNFIKLQKAGGGGDMPEALDAALETAIDSLSWSSNARTKIMFIILDAPSHNGSQDKIYSLMYKAAAKGIRIVPIVCSGADKSTEFLMRSVALATNGTYLFLTNDSGKGNKHIEPTTDAYSVELLNNLLPRIIQQMVYTNTCTDQQKSEPIVKTHKNVLNIKVSPNPTKGQVNITTTKPLKELFIADFTGKILMRIPVNAKQYNWVVNIANFPAGTYIVKYVTTENGWGAEKIVLIH
jgi:hypothetical protein